MINVIILFRLLRFLSLSSYSVLSSTILASNLICASTNTFSTAKILPSKNFSISKLSNKAIFFNDKDSYNVGLNSLIDSIISYLS